MSQVDRVDRRFWLTDKDGIRRFPIRRQRQGDNGPALFAVSNQGNRADRAIYLDDLEDVIRHVTEEGYRVRAVREFGRQEANLVGLGGSEITGWGRAESNDSTSVTYWQALAAVTGQPDAGWSTSAKNWVRTKTRGDAYVSCAYNSREGWTRVGIGLIGSDPDRMYQDLLARRAAVERAIGEPLEWDTKEERNKRQIFIKLPCDPNDRSDWPRQHAWLEARLPSFEALLAEI